MEEYTIETFSQLTFKQMKQTYVYKNIPLGYSKSTLKKRDLLHLLREHPEFFEEDEPCMICYESVSKNDTKLKCCNKIIHQECLDKCCQHDDRCPHCRAEIPSKYREELDQLIEKIKNLIDMHIDDYKLVNIFIRGISMSYDIKISDIEDTREELLDYYFNHYKFDYDDAERNQRIWLWHQELGHHE